MLKAMESGPGSISTTHARSAEHTVEKLVSCAMESGPQVTRELAISKIAAAIDVVIYLHVDIVEEPVGTQRRRRWVHEVLVVEPSPDAVMGYSATSVFCPTGLQPPVRRLPRRDLGPAVPRPDPPRLRPGRLQRRVHSHARTQPQSHARPQPWRRSVMSTFIAAMSGVLVVGGVIGMVVAHLPAPPRAPRPARAARGPSGRPTRQSWRKASVRTDGCCSSGPRPGSSSRSLQGG